MLIVGHRQSRPPPWTQSRCSAQEGGAGGRQPGPRHRPALASLRSRYRPLPTGLAPAGGCTPSVGPLPLAFAEVTSRDSSPPLLPAVQGGAGRAAWGRDHSPQLSRISVLTKGLASIPGWGWGSPPGLTWFRGVLTAPRWVGTPPTQLQLMWATLTVDTHLPRAPFVGLSPSSLAEHGGELGDGQEDPGPLWQKVKRN